MSFSKSRSFSIKVIIGTLLVVLGALLIMFNLDILSGGWKSVIFSWQMLLILIGLASCRFSVLSGLLPIFVGAFFLIPRLAPIYPSVSLFSDNFVNTYWPVLIIVIGFLFIVQSIVWRVCGSRWNAVSKKHSKSIMDKQEDGSIDYEFIFSGAKQVYVEPVFYGGRIRAKFGGIELDLRNTTLPEGVTSLKVEATFGGLTIYAPASWHIVYRNQNTMGGYDDHRKVDAATLDMSRTLEIESNCSFGGFDVRS